MKRERCPIGPLGLHTMNHERTECIWCGPGRMAWKPGRWVKETDGTFAWTVEPERVPASVTNLETWRTA